MKILKKNHLNFPKKLVISKTFFFSNHGKYVVLWFGQNFGETFSSLKKQHEFTQGLISGNIFPTTVSQSYIESWIYLLHDDKANITNITVTFMNYLIDNELINLLLFGFLAQKLFNFFLSMFSCSFPRTSVKLVS